ncbi:hypothetical protein KY321_01255, partial [Candidatus Woesearchaeota archaeon]|nr:hypothetical protein [Candidatus Woesearchaeota archaeon]
MVLDDHKSCFEKTRVAIYSNNNQKLKPLFLESKTSKNTFFFADDNLSPYFLGLVMSSGSNYTKDDLKIYDLIKCELRDVETFGQTPKLAYFKERFCVRNELNHRDMMNVKVSDNFPTDLYRDLIGRNHIPAYFNFRNELVGVDESYADEVSPKFVEVLGCYFKGRTEF